MTKDKAAAVVTIRGANRMTRRGRRSIAAWLRKNALWLEKHGRELGPIFRASYLY
jgi:hypothetical protein